ncbi:hypothetical protein JTB14_019249 [Gonioctena quinquepunctata]|nr:hypothetical protein JTB14_019249 [Gonioctena quinquepunctata]
MERKCLSIDKNCPNNGNEIQHPQGVIEQLGRNNFLRISGLPEQDEENILEIILDFLNGKLNVPCSHPDIDDIFRIGKSKARTGHPEKSLNNMALSIFEDLSKSNYELFQLTRRKHGRKNIWTMGGKITQLNKAKRLVRRDEDLWSIAKIFTPNQIHVTYFLVTTILQSFRFNDENEIVTNMALMMETPDLQSYNKVLNGDNKTFDLVFSNFQGDIENDLQFDTNMNYEDEQERLRRLWEKIEIDEEPNDNEDELASEIDFTEERNTDSELEQDCDEEDDIENVAPPNKILIALDVKKFSVIDSDIHMLEKRHQKAIDEQKKVTNSSINLKEESDELRQHLLSKWVPQDRKRYEDTQVVENIPDGTTVGKFEISTRSEEEKFPSHRRQIDQIFWCQHTFWL